ncbi:MAG: Crp/Fnr family transcriptional regulator [Verrucomicrobiae bacterium]|nr:Crp/Fnr family transcriptional regulator [Verrucomicrobiae bacterium]
MESTMHTVDQIVSLLQQNDTFADAPEEILRDLASGMKERPVEAGTDLIEQGKKCGSLFAATEGDFGVFIDGESEPVAQLGRGRVFGEIGAVSGIKATATVRALSDGNVLEIPGPALHRAFAQSPKLAESVLRSLSRYLGAK